MAEFIKDLTWFRKTFPPRGARGMPATLDEIVSPTVDVLGSLRFEDLIYRLILGTVGLTSVEGNVVASTDVQLILGCDVSHDDATTRRLSLMILNNTGTLTARIPQDHSPQDVVSLGTRIACTLPRFYLGPGERLRAETTSIGAGARLSLRYRLIALPIGELVRI